VKALILRNKVVQVAAAEFPVHPELSWVDVPANIPVQPGWIYTGSNFVEPPPIALGTGGAGGSGIGGDVNIGGRGGDGFIGGAGGDGIGDGVNIGGRGGNAMVAPTLSPNRQATEKLPWWRSLWSIAVGVATIVAAVVAVLQVFAG